MRKTLLTPLLLILILATLLNSCSSVYVSPEVTSSASDKPEVDSEYFTAGSLSSCGDSAAGFFYKGCWIYIETQMTVGPRGQNSNGEIHYGEVQMERVVKYNPITDTVSSPCMDPACTHSFESECVMLKPHELGGVHKSFRIMKIVGDWLILRLQYHDEVLVTKNYVTFYNLQTGETKRFFEEDLETEVMTRWVGGSAFENKFYNIKQTLDYSETSFDMTNTEKSILDYSPKTKQILCEYDLDSGKITELFEIPENYGLIAISNKRFFFQDDAYAIYSCNRDGSNMAKEEYLDFQPENSIGTYAYSLFELDGFTVFDIETNQKRSVSVEYDEYSECSLADDGVLFDHVEGYEKYIELKSSLSQFYEEHKGMDYAEIASLFEIELQNALHSGPTKIYKCDLDGENMRLIYEEDNSMIASVYGTKDFLFCIRSKLTDGQTVSERCAINLNTGEIKTPGLLDIVVPSRYTND